MDQGGEEKALSSTVSGPSDIYTIVLYVYVSLMMLQQKMQSISIKDMVTSKFWEFLTDK